MKQQTQLIESINNTLRSAVIGQKGKSSHRVHVQKLVQHLQTTHDSKVYYRNLMKSDVKQLQDINDLMGKNPSFSTRKKFQKRITKHSLNLRTHLHKFIIDCEVFNSLLLITKSLGINVEGEE